MARKKQTNEVKKSLPPDAYIEGAGIVENEGIVETLRKNFMPYAMSVIVSRALPEIDGFKPSHRKLLYTMYKMGLLNGDRTKSANIVGQTMKLHPHGDLAIYDTMVRMTRGNEALLYAYVDSKGNFGKAYSRDMSCAAPRYTEAKLEAICAELFGDIDMDTVDFVPNYDNTMMEPTLFPTSFPTVLLNSNVGIAVSMASNICPFNLDELCETTISLIKDENHDIISTLRGPDFPGGGFILYDEAELETIYNTGRGTVKVRADWKYDKANNCIEITEIPPTTTVEAIIDKIIDLVKAGKIREISDLRDETDLSGLKLTLDLKRGVDSEKLMQRLFKATPLQDSFYCNFNVLIAGTPKVLGVREILLEWIAFRTECVRRRVAFDLKKKRERLHLLLGLQKILLDIDKAVEIVRKTDEESEVVPNLMIGFGIDEVQAEYVAEIKLRHLNREYILKRISDVEQLQASISELAAILSDRRKVRSIIVDELRNVVKKYSKPRRSRFIYEGELEEETAFEEEIPDYPVHILFSKEGYFKKITPQSLRMSGEQKLKDGDVIETTALVTNLHELLFFTDMAQVYKARVCDFEDGKASILGEYIPAKLGFDEGENVIACIYTLDFSETLLVFYDNGKVGKVAINLYETKTRRKKLTSAYSSKAKAVKFAAIAEDMEFALLSTAGRMLVFSSAMLLPKATRDTQGVQVMTLKKNHFLEGVYPLTQELLTDPARYRTKTIPAAGALAKDFAPPEQLSLF